MQSKSSRSSANHVSRRSQGSREHTSLGACVDLAYRTLMALKYTMPRPRMIVIQTAAGRWSICGGVALGSG